MKPVKKSILIADTTREEREEIVRRWEANNDDFSEDRVNFIELYADYVEGKRELQEIYDEYVANYYEELAFRSLMDGMY